MGLAVDWHLCTQTILYYAASLFGIITSVPIGVTSSHFHGQCILYSDAIMTSNNTAIKINSDGASSCTFSVYVNVFAVVFYSFAMGCYGTYALCKKDPTIGSQMWVMPFTLINSGVTIVLFVSSCIISVGFVQFCNHLLAVTHASSCASLQSHTWSDDGNGKTFYHYYATAQTSSWICFLIYATQLGCCILRLYRNHKARSKSVYEEPVSDTKDIVSNEELPSTA